MLEEQVQPASLHGLPSGFTIEEDGFGMNRLGKFQIAGDFEMILESDFIVTGWGCGLARRLTP
jgi:hypothetical protein